MTRLHPHEGALIKLKEKSLTLFPLFPLAAWTIPLEQTRCGFTSPHTLQLLSLARDLQEVPWNDHLGKGSEAQRMSPSSVWRGVCPRSFHSPLFSVLARVLQGSHKQGTIPEPLTGSGLWFSSALAFVQEMRNRREPQQRDLWEKQFVSVSASSSVLKQPQSQNPIFELPEFAPSHSWGGSLGPCTRNVLLGFDFWFKPTFATCIPQFQWYLPFTTQFPGEFMQQ